MKPLTVNQLIVLLEIHRGTFDKANNLGTVLTDLMLLEKLNLIQHGGDDWHITRDASAYIERAKQIELPKPKKDLAMYLHELNTLGFTLTIGASPQAIGQTQILMSDDNTGEHYYQILPTDHHLQTKLLDCIDFVKNKLIEQLKTQPK